MLLVDPGVGTLLFQGMRLWEGHMVMIDPARNRCSTCSEDLWVIDQVLATVMKDS